MNRVSCRINRLLISRFNLKAGETECRSKRVLVFCKNGYVLFLYNNRFKERFKVKVRLQIFNTQPLVTDVIRHLNFLFCAFFFHFVELICFVPFQDGNKEILSDVDDLGN